MSGAVGLHTATIGSGPVPVVLLHGLLGQGQNLSTAARGIADLATSLLVDVPNHGRSGRTEHVDYLELADVIAAELRARGAAERPVVLVGHSMGGKIAMCLTLRHPDLVAGLVVVDVSPVDHDGAESFGRIIDAMLALDLTRLRSRAEADEALASAIPDPTVRGFVLQNLRRTDDGPGWAWLGDPRLLRAELDVVCGFPDMAGAHWDGPVLWVAGADSDYVQDRHEPVMRALFPRVRLVRVRGAGHWVHADRPQVFIGLLRAFLAPWSAGAGTRPTRPGGVLSPA